MLKFGKHNLSDTIKAISGIGSTTIDVPFVPDYIKAEFQGPVLSLRPEQDLLGDDEVYWNLVAVTPTSYQLTIAWSIYSETREIYYRVSRLTVDPV